jgi:hypothetical protein
MHMGRFKNKRIDPVSPCQITIVVPVSRIYAKEPFLRLVSGTYITRLSLTMHCGGLSFQI